MVPKSLYRFCQTFYYFCHWLIPNYYSYLFAHNIGQAKTVEVTIFHRACGAEVDGIDGKLIAFSEVFCIRIKFVRTFIWLWFFGVAINFSAVVINIAKILYPYQQSWYSDYVSITDVFKSIISDLYSLISINKMCRLSLALSYHYHHRFYSLYDFD